MLGSSRPAPGSCLACAGPDMVSTMLRQAAVLIAFSLGGIASAGAQSGPQGIGFAQAEEGTWTCRAGDPVTALDCARDKCRREAGGQDCYRTAWCFPAGWAGLMTVWYSDFHATRPLCGAPNEAALSAALRALCDNDPNATSCDLTLIVDPDGLEREGGANWQGPAAPR